MENRKRRQNMRVEQIGDCTLYLADCMDVLPTLGKVDAVVTDPPYGIKPEYFEIACKRIHEAYNQPDMFIQEEKRYQIQGAMPL